MNIPPAKKTRSKWSVRKKFLKKSVEAVMYFAVKTFFKLIKLHPQTHKILKCSFELGNPADTKWPTETIPMISRLLSVGFWNYSFFQFNRDFFFPFWASEQYNPSNKSFIPRSHNLLSMNQTHRNWVSLSFPGKKEEISLDQAAAIMPYAEAYTIEFATLEKGRVVRPHDDVSKLKFNVDKLSHIQVTWMGVDISITATPKGCKVKCAGKRNLIVSIRPFNMEGIALLGKLNYHKDKYYVDGDVDLQFTNRPTHYLLSAFNNGDALKGLAKSVKIKNDAFETKKIHRKKRKNKVQDTAGVATAAFLFSSADLVEFEIDDNQCFKIQQETLPHFDIKSEKLSHSIENIWKYYFPQLLEINLPGEYGEAFRTTRNHLMTLWDYDSVTPGSFTYNHFWIRDAAIMMKALLLIGGHTPVKRIVERFPKLIDRSGNFHSQKGEYDANGQALWIVAEYAKITKDTKPLTAQAKSLNRLIKWIGQAIKKNGGVLPPGFSAEHLGVTDWYLWDNFWALGGLYAIEPFKDIIRNESIRTTYNNLRGSLDHYLKDYKYYPAALGRKKDAGMIGSICAVYPLATTDFFNKRMLNTVDTIRKRYFLKGGFFQENIHSGINPYLSLQIAECYLHFGDPRSALKILDRILGWSAFAYTYPEAVHPKTGGGCMGDGFHGWAFAEMVTLFRNLFLIDVEDQAILLPGLRPEWFKSSFSAKNLHSSIANLSVEYKNKTLEISGFAQPQEILLALPNQVKIEEILSEVETSEKVKWPWVISQKNTDYNYIRIKLGETKFKARLTAHF